MKNWQLKMHFLAAALVVPTDEISVWNQLSYSKIPAHEIKVENKELVIQVKASASPLVYVLPKVQLVSGFQVELVIDGEMKPQKTGFEEDSYLRFGLVATGDKKLNAFQKALAPDWIKKLFALSPKGYGLDKIYFFNLAQNQALLNQSRNHPQSELIHEKIVQIRKNDLSLFEYQLEKPISTAALWLSIDGDDSQSNYTVRIKNLKIFNP